MLPSCLGESHITGAVSTDPDRREPASRLLTRVLAAFVLGVAAAAAVHRSVEDATLVFIHAPHEIVPEGHKEQVKIVKAAVPAGSTLFYLMDVPEAWQLGLWQRSLYPAYIVQPAHGAAQLKEARRQALRDGKKVDFAISAGNPPLNPGFQWQAALPPYPNGIPATLGKLPPLQ